MRTTRDVRLAGHLISVIWGLTIAASLLAGSPSPTGDRGGVIAGLGIVMGVVLATRAPATARRLQPTVLAVAVVANAVAAAVALDAPRGVVAGTLTAAAAFVMGMLTDREIFRVEPDLPVGRADAIPAAAHARLAAAVAADPGRTALLLADADILRAVAERCGPLEGEALLQEVAAELAAAGAPVAPHARAAAAPTVEPHPLEGAELDARVPEHAT